MLIGKAIYAGGAGGLKPEIIVTAEAGSTLTCGAQTYTLGASETTHTFTVALGTYIVTATKGSDSATETVLVDMVAQYAVELEYITDVTVTTSGVGDNTYCYARINGTKRSGGGFTYTVQQGDEITFAVYGRSTTYAGEVNIDGTNVLSVTNQTTQTYVWTVPSGIRSVAVNFSYTSTSSQRNGKITVTTS